MTPQMRWSYAKLVWKVAVDVGFLKTPSYALMSQEVGKWLKKIGYNLLVNGVELLGL